MPELPDVEAFRKLFNKNSLNKQIRKADAVKSRVIKGISPKTLRSALTGETFISSDRHGKYLIASASGKKYLIMHFGMTGSLRYYENSAEKDKHVHLIIEFSDGSRLAYRDPRKFGAIYLEENPEQFIRRKRIGPDPLKGNYTFSDFRKAAEDKKINLKAFLMNQSVIAGIGNVYSDEILFSCGMHPERRVNKLTELMLKELFGAMKKVLKDSVKYESAGSKFPDDYLLNSRKNKSECPLCGGEIKMKTIAGRSSYFCLKHQK